MPSPLRVFDLYLLLIQLNLGPELLLPLPLGHPRDLILEVSGSAAFSSCLWFYLCFLLRCLLLMDQLMKVQMLPFFQGKLLAMLLYNNAHRAVSSRKVHVNY
nr:hypothetical protein Q903MT_gene1252 [Picea sitchensis]